MRGQRAREGKEEPKPKRRRGSAETAAPKEREEARPAPRDESGAVAVRAQAKFVRSAPRKARLVMDHIRGKGRGGRPRDPAA